MNLSNFIADIKSGECLVMGILNCTPDSFFSGSRKQTEEEIRGRVKEIMSEGGDIIDVGACSTRPGCVPASEEEEMQRLRFAMPIVKEIAPDMPISVDTFRASVAERCIQEFGDVIINDISEGEDPDMFAVVAKYGVPYILMSVKPTIKEMMLGFAEKVQRLRDLGAKDIILDPGFGFGKTLEQNYEILNDVDFLREFNLPILIGISRKSMIWRSLGITPEEALNGTSVLNTISLMKGAADILRVHDVKAAKETIALMEALNKAKR